MSARKLAEQWVAERGKRDGFALTVACCEEAFEWLLSNQRFASKVHTPEGFVALFRGEGEYGPGSEPASPETRIENLRSALVWVKSRYCLGTGAPLFIEEALRKDDLASGGGE